jgi:hypothetical protein
VPLFWAYKYCESKVASLFFAQGNPQPGSVFPDLPYTFLISGLIPVPIHKRRFSMTAKPMTFSMTLNNDLMTFFNPKVQRIPPQSNENKKTQVK